jgi:protein TonB
VSLVGRDVLAPRLVREVKPNYPAEAMRAKVQGIVTVDAVVNADGSVGVVRVARSVDREYGLDDEAVTCAKTWRFKPASRKSDGGVIPVMVQIDIAFALPTKQ